MKSRCPLPYHVLLCLTSLLVVGCQHDPWADRFLTAQPSEKEVAGTYVVDADSQKRPITLPMSNGVFPVSPSARISLSSDHKAEFFNVPEDYFGKPCSVTGRGSWSLEKNDSFSVVRAKIINEEANSLCKGEFGYELMLYGKKPPYKLHITISDPDSGDVVQFEKQQ
jgi:hypothetical protein